jgi:cytochrome c-type biogenesis protein CcmH/NrfF
VRLLAVLLGSLVLAAPAAAATCPKSSTSDIADEVMCLQCGVPLNLAEDAPSAKRERAFIQQLVDRCKSKDEIKTALVAQFGDKVLGDPKAKATWLVPAIGFGAAVLALGVGAWRWRRRRRDPLVPAAAPPSAADSELEADMQRYKL